MRKKTLEIENGVLKYYRGHAKRLIVPEGVREIGERALMFSSELVEVYLPASLACIGKHAFLSCRALRTVHLSKSALAELPASCFDGCESLEKILLPPSLKRIGESAFSYCSSLSCVRFPDGLREIGREAFLHCEKLQEAVLPEGLSAVGEKAFFACSSLVRLVLPESLSTVGKNAFSEAPLAETPSLPNGGCSVSTLIGQGCFDAEVLWRILLSDRAYVRRFGGMVKRSLPEILNFLAEWEDISRLSALLSAWGCVPMEILDRIAERLQGWAEGTGTLMEYRSLHYPPERLQRAREAEAEKMLGLRAWSQEDWAKLFRFSVRGESVTLTGYRGDGEEVLLPSYVGKYPVVSVSPSFCREAAGRHLFLTEEEHPYLRTVDGSILTADGAVLLCGYVGESGDVRIPDGVFEIGEAAFFGCERLRELTLPEGVTRIGRDAFSGCRNLARVEIRGKAVEIGAGAFCRNAALVALSVPDVRGIGAGAFAYCSALKEVRVERSLLRIGRSAFEACEQLAWVQLPDSLQEICDGSFLRCHSLESLALPKGLVAIGKRAFLGCSALSSVALPQGIRALPTRVFASCGSLSRVTLSEGLEVIDRRAFDGCDALEEITLPASLCTVGREAFRNTPISRITFAGCAVRLDRDTFTGCDQHRFVIRYAGTRKQWRRTFPSGGWGIDAVVHCTDGDVVEEPLIPF